MKWNPFASRRRTATDELRDRNRALGRGLAEERAGIFRRSAKFFRGLFRDIRPNEDVGNRVEELLLALDFGPFLSEHLAKKLSSEFSGRSPGPDDVRGALRRELLAFYGDADRSLNLEDGRTNIILIVGSNGSGKTTCIAKLAHRFRESGGRVLVVAGDTFRAGAVDQLRRWTDRLGVDIAVPTRHKEDPAALVYRSLTGARESSYDVVICDTSGRQHNNNDLLRELAKVHRTIGRFDPTAPHETLLVIDATIGQASLLQAEKFLGHASATGIVLTKMDNMLKGGVVFAIKERFGVPVKLVGTGENPEDLMEFDPEPMVDSWLSSIPGE